MVHAVRANLKDVQREYPRVLLHVNTSAVPPPRGRGASVYKGSVAVSCARVERTVIEERVRQALGAAQPVSVWVAQNASLRLLQIIQQEIHLFQIEICNRNKKKQTTSRKIDGLYISKATKTLCISLTRGSWKILHVKKVVQ